MKDTTKGSIVAAITLLIAIGLGVICYLNPGTAL